ncbi:MAG TPA: methanogenesis marker 16 metalloprotein [Candidatus Lokiarchaeia archaeon]|nr:methanogenesis marker 16 metalloprotein [Candidatus Lokiarchaeia archaeon]
MMSRTLDDINEKIKNGTAVVMTAQEFIDTIASGESLRFEDVDVVTTGTKGLMSGILGIFTFRVTPPKVHRKFTQISMNGIPGYPGPCPNEFLGVVDVLLYATAHSTTDDQYSGGVLFRDLVEGKVIHVVATSYEGDEIEKDVTLEDMQFARLLGTRQGFKNYNAMVNPTNEPVDTIFSTIAMQPDLSELTFSGCGAINMFQNDPDFQTFGVGTPMLVNGAKGYLVGPGTRNYVLKPNMMTIADFKGMKPEYMGGFKTSFGVEPICSMAAAIPILNEKIFNNLVRSDGDVPLTIMNVVGREKLAEVTYGDVWNNNFIIKFEPKKCDDCAVCQGEELCPTEAFHKKKGIDRSRCFNCGLCAVTCKCCPDAFVADMRSVKIDGKEVPVVLRQSDRQGAIKLAGELKAKILKGEFDLVKPTGTLEFSEEMK